MTKTESQTETESLPESITELREDGALTLINKETNDRAILYSAPDASFLGDAYTVELSLDGVYWYPMDVWTARVAVQVKSGQYDLYTTYFVNFDCQGDIQLRVTPKADGDVRIRPAGRNQSRLDNGAVILTVSEPCQLSLEVGGDIYGNLQIFANPIEEVNKKDPRILYLGPGVHTLENCSLIRAQATSVGGEMHDTPTLYIPSGKTLYLAGGAVLQATVVMENAKNCAIAGRGMIDILPWNRDNNIRSSQNLPSPYGIRVFNSKNVSISGVLVRDAMSYSIYAGNTTGLTVDNFKAIAAAQWSDGFDAMATSNVTIQNSFFRTNDDCIAIYGSRWSNKGSSRHYEVTNCILWADNAHAINIGTIGNNNAAAPDVVEDVTFRDIDILEVHSMNHTGAFSISCGGEVIVRDILVENVVAEFTKSDLIRLHFITSGGYYGSLIENITFRNIECKVANAGVYLSGHSDSRMVQNITFDGVYIGDVLVTSDFAGFHKNNYVKSLIFG